MRGKRKSKQPNAKQRTANKRPVVSPMVAASIGAALLSVAWFAASASFSIQPEVRPSQPATPHATRASSAGAWDESILPMSTVASTDVDADLDQAWDLIHGPWRSCYDSDPNQIRRCDEHLRKALKLFQSACKADKRSHDAFFGAATCLSYQDLPAEALPYLQRAITIRPNNPSNQLNLGVTAAMLKEWDVAVKGYVGTIRAANKKIAGGGEGASEAREIKATALGQDLGKMMLQRCSSPDDQQLVLEEEAKAFRAKRQVSDLVRHRRVHRSAQNI